LVVEIGVEAAVGEGFNLELELLVADVWGGFNKDW
jgi:hypothetical protein